MSFLEGMNPDSRVWVYQAEHILADNEVEIIEQDLGAFLNQWAAHNQKLLASGGVLYNCFIIIAVDEASIAATGCSIDSSVRFVQALENRFKVSFTNRLALAYRNAVSGEISIESLDAFKMQIEKGEIKEDTIVFNNLVKSIAELQTKWEVKASESWHAQLF